MTNEQFEKYHRKAFRVLITAVSLLFGLCIFIGWIGVKAINQMDTQRRKVVVEDHLDGYSYQGDFPYKIIGDEQPGITGTRQHPDTAIAWYAQDTIYILYAK